MRTINAVALVGNICSDVEKRTTQSGVTNVTFRLAVRRRFKNADGQYESDFIQCVAWRQTAEFIGSYFAKGAKIGVTGSIQTRSYQAQDGSKRYVTEVVCDTAEFVAGKDDKPQPQAKAEPYAEEDDALPF